MESKNILVVDDNPEIREIVRILLESEGYGILEASCGREAIGMVDESIDLIILDVMMPGESGYRVCVKMRSITQAPILFLTAKTQDSDKSMGFSAGGDDYLAKPFSNVELVSRVKALLRRYYIYQGKKITENSKCVTIDALCINLDLNEVTKDGEEITLTDIEYKILSLMAKNRRKIFSVQNIFESVWNEPYFYSSNNTVMVHIRNLRKKIEEDPQNPRYVNTVWGKGYRLG